MQIKNLGKECGFWFQLNFEASPPILIISDPKTQKQEYIFGKLGEYQRYYFDLKKFIIGVKIAIDEQNNVYWYKDKLFHREDGPAITHSNGDKAWYKNGELHREDGPARIWTDGQKEWFINGKRHREDGPASILSDGSRYWYKNNNFIKRE